MSARRPPSAGTSPVETRTGGAAVASGKTPNSSVLAGREHELERIDVLLGDAAAGRGGALLVVGEPGVGKTTLLEVARARGDAFTCLGTRGIQAESHLAWAGLFGLLNPIRHRVADLTEPQASALGSALAWSSGAATADPFLLGQPPSRSSPRPPSTGRCWCSWTTCSGWTRSPRPPSPSRRADSVPTPSHSCWPPERARRRPGSARACRCCPSAVSHRPLRRRFCLPARRQGSWSVWSPRRRATPSPSSRWRRGWTTRTGSAQPSSPTRCPPEIDGASTSGPLSPSSPPRLAGRAVPGAGR